MHAFLIYWAGAFIALAVAIFLTVIIYGLMGDGLELNGWWSEGFTALFVSAGQAAGMLLQHLFPGTSTHAPGFHGHGRVEFIVFALSFWLGYVITHLSSWDWLEYVILSLVDSVLAIGVILLVSRWVPA